MPNEISRTRRTMYTIITVTFKITRKKLNSKLTEKAEQNKTLKVPGNRYSINEIYFYVCAGKYLTSRSPKKLYATRF